MTSTLKLVSNSIKIAYSFFVFFPLSSGFWYHSSSVLWSSLGFAYVLTVFTAVWLAGNSLREDFTFRHSFSAEVAKLLKVSPGHVVIVQPEKFRSKHEPSSRTFSVKVESFTSNRLLWLIWILFQCVWNSSALQMAVLSFSHRWCINALHRLAAAIVLIVALLWSANVSSVALGGEKHLTSTRSSS